MFEKIVIAFSRPGSDLLSRVLRRSTIGAGAFHGRVRNGNGCSHPAITTRSAKGNVDAMHQHCPFSLANLSFSLTLERVPKRSYGTVLMLYIFEKLAQALACFLF